MASTQSGTHSCFQKTTLESGVRVLTESIPSARSIAVGLWVVVGSRDEGPGEEGLSHFVEHMVFKGTRKRRMHQIARRMESVGGYLNAFTTKEHTCYYARGLDEHLERAIDAVCDLVLTPVFPERELEKEKDVVLEEMRMVEDTPEDLIFDRFESVVYRDHELGCPILGRVDALRAFTRDRLHAFVQRHYVPNRLVLAVAGNVRHDAVVRITRKALAEMTRNPEPLHRIPANGYVSREMAEPRPIQQTHVVMGTRGIRANHSDWSACAVLNTVLGGGMSSRLHQNIREKHGFCYHIYSFLNAYSDAGDLGVYAAVDRTKADRVKQLIRKELQQLINTPVSRRTLGQVKNQVRGSIMLGLESMSNRMMRIARQELYLGEYLTLDDVTKSIERVSEEDLQRVATTLFDRDRLSTVALTPQADS